MAIADQLLEQLEPIARLSAGRKKELAALCFIETVNKNINPMRMNVTKAAQALYLIKGDLGLLYNDEKKAILRGGTEAAKHSINTNSKIKDTIALTDVEILRIDMDLLDIMMTWDQLSGNDNLAINPQEKITVKQQVGSKNKKHARSAGEWIKDTSVFSAFNLQVGVFSQLPVANVEEMFKRMDSITVTAGQKVIQQGGVGDYYYLIQSGTAEVSRVVDASQPAVILAELKEGSAFGEEALASDNKRNATVKMSADGELLRLNKQDFVELLKAPLIKQVTMAEAKEKVLAGAVWADVRLPSEYQYDHIAGAISLPLSEIRNLASTLDTDKEYVVYCQTGRRSSAAAFIMAQLGLQAVVLAGGTRNSAA